MLKKRLIYLSSISLYNFRLLLFIGLVLFLLGLNNLNLVYSASFNNIFNIGPSTDQKLEINMPAWLGAVHLQLQQMNCSQVRGAVLRPLKGNPRARREGHERLQDGQILHQRHRLRRRLHQDPQDPEAPPGLLQRQGFEQEHQPPTSPATPARPSLTFCCSTLHLCPSVSRPPENTTIPTKHTHTSTTYLDNQPAVTIQV